MNSDTIKRPFSFFATLTGAITLLFSAFALATIPDGLWGSTCKDGLLKTQLIENGHHSTTTEKFHRDRFCKNLSFEFITSGGLSYPAQQGLIDFTYSQIQLVVHIQDVIKDFNQREVCGRTDWELAKPQTIAGHACALFNINRPTQIPHAGEVRYGIYKIENDKLYYGKLSQEYDSSTPERRPQEYDAISYDHGRFHAFERNM